MPRTSGNPRAFLPSISYARLFDPTPIHFHRDPPAYPSTAPPHSSGDFLPIQRCPGLGCGAYITNCSCGYNYPLKNVLDWAKKANQIPKDSTTLPARREDCPYCSSNCKRCDQQKDRSKNKPNRHVYLGAPRMACVGHSKQKDADKVRAQKLDNLKKGEVIFNHLINDMGDLIRISGDGGYDLFIAFVNEKNEAYAGRRSMPQVTAFLEAYFESEERRPTPLANKTEAADPLMTGQADLAQLFPITEQIDMTQGDLVPDVQMGLEQWNDNQLNSLVNNFSGGIWDQWQVQGPPAPSLQATQGGADSSPPNFTLHPRSLSDPEQGNPSNFYQVERGRQVSVPPMPFSDTGSDQNPSWSGANAIPTNMIGDVFVPSPPFEMSNSGFANIFMGASAPSVQGGIPSVHTDNKGPESAQRIFYSSGDDFHFGDTPASHHDASRADLYHTLGISPTPSLIHESGEETSSLPTPAGAEAAFPSSAGSPREASAARLVADSESVNRVSIDPIDELLYDFEVSNNIQRHPGSFLSTCSQWQRSIYVTLHQNGFAGQLPSHYLNADVEKGLIALPKLLFDSTANIPMAYIFECASSSIHMKAINVPTIPRHDDAHESPMWTEKHRLPYFQIVRLHFGQFSILRDGSLMDPESVHLRWVHECFCWVVAEILEGDGHPTRILNLLDAQVNLFFSLSNHLRQRMVDSVREDCKDKGCSLHCDYTRIFVGMLAIIITVAERACLQAYRAKAWAELDKRRVVLKKAMKVASKIMDCCAVHLGETLEELARGRMSDEKRRDLIIRTKIWDGIIEKIDRLYLTFFDYGIFRKDHELILRNFLQPGGKYYQMSEREDVANRPLDLGKIWAEVEAHIDKPSAASAPCSTLLLIPQGEMGSSSDLVEWAKWVGADYLLDEEMHSAEQGDREKYQGDEDIESGRAVKKNLIGTKRS